MRISDWSSDVCSSDLIRSKEIWVVGADRYRNPDDDLPKDFDARREAYYTGLNLTADARAFSSAIREELAQELLLLNANIPRNDKVRSEEHTSELQSLMRTSYAVLCLKKKKK